SDQGPEAARRRRSAGPVGEARNRSQLITLAVQPFAFTVSLPSFVVPLEANVVTTHSQHGTIYHHLGGSLSPERGSPCTNCSRLPWPRASTASPDWPLVESSVPRRREPPPTQNPGAP